jgi:NAD(P)-dependent dehydrogenase (short-subunit alcohol dehydrogenase family)
LKTVLITGAARGIGSAAADLFLDKGYRVIAADILFDKVHDSRPSREILQVPLDVTSDNSVRAAGKIIRESNLSIDILINNAGVFDFFPLSETRIEALEKTIQTNALGAARMIHEFLPELIRNHGRVIQISSESIKLPGLFQPYQVSKIALEAYSRSVRQELELKGVKLVIIRPGATNTGLYGKLDEYKNPMEGSHFNDEFKAFVKNTVRFKGKAIEPEVVAGLIYKSATCKSPKYIYRINNNPVLTWLSILPDRLMDRFVVKLIRKKRRS